MNNLRLKFKKIYISFSIAPNEKDSSWHVSNKICGGSLWRKLKDTDNRNKKSQ